MVTLGYRDDIQDDLAVPLIRHLLAMLPFCYVVHELLVRLNDRVKLDPRHTA